MGSSAGLAAARVASEQLFAPAFLKEWVMQAAPFLSRLHRPSRIGFRKPHRPLRRQGRGTDRSFEMTISGLGPHGERAAPPERVILLPDDRTAAKAAGWRVAVVLHTLESDWASSNWPA